MKFIKTMKEVKLYVHYIVISALTWENISNFKTTWKMNTYSVFAPNNVDAWALLENIKFLIKKGKLHIHFLQYTICTFFMLLHQSNHIKLAFLCNMGQLKKEISMDISEKNNSKLTSNRNHSEFHSGFKECLKTSVLYVVLASLIYNTEKTH